MVLANVNDLRKTIVADFTTFVNDPAQRTADKCSSIPVLSA